MLSQRLSPTFQTVVISPRNYFVFTPLLSNAAVGTLEFRNALEPVRNRRKPHIEFMQGWADDVNFGQKIVTVEESVVDQSQSTAHTKADSDAYGSLTEAKSERYSKRKEGKRFDIAYDKLVVAVGCYSQTFGTKGVKENAYFMKDVGDSRRVRKRILECFELAALPTTSEALRKQLLHFAIIGGGPTGMEFAAELSDLIHQDLSRLYPELIPSINITVHDVAPKVLSMFDDKLADYAMKTFKRQHIAIKTNSHIEELRRGLPHTRREDGTIGDVADTQGCFTLTTKEDGEMGVGMCVWSTGNMMNPFIQRTLQKAHQFPTSSASLTNGKDHDQSPNQDWMIEKNRKTGAIVVDDALRVQLHSQSTSSAQTSQGEENTEQSVSRATLNDVFALGDNATIRNQSLPATAQTANQQAVWLAKQFNEGTIERQDQHFTFKNLGVMAYVGSQRAIVNTEGPDISGRAAWLVWRGAYLMKTVSWRNRILISTYW